MSATNFYRNLKILRENDFVTDAQLVNALIKNFVTTEEYTEIMGGEEAALNGVKTSAIAKTKTDLEDYLASHPYTTEDGKSYSVTFEKQTLLANEIASYQLATAAEQPYQLTWNTTGDECTNMTIEEMTALALAINAYVKPLISYQQAQEVAIRNAETIEAVLAIGIDYASV